MINTFFCGVYTKHHSKGHYSFFLTFILTLSPKNRTKKCGRKETSHDILSQQFYRLLVTFYTIYRIQLLLKVIIYYLFSLIYLTKQNKKRVAMIPINLNVVD